MASARTSSDAALFVFFKQPKLRHNQGLPISTETNRTVPMGYFSLLRRHPRTIGFGFLQAFFSGLGQTHFVSLYSPILMSTFALSATEYGSLYSLMTLISGFTITFVGPWIDRKDARHFSVFIAIGLIFSILFLSQGSSLWLVCIGIFGLRFFGQGLCSSLSSITTARYFHEGRGKALSLAQMGYAFYEGLITPLAAYLLGLLSLSSFGFVLLSFVSLIYLPLGWFLTRPIPHFNKITASEHRLENREDSQKSWTRKEVFSSWQVYLLIPHTLMPPFALTGLFFHQALIAQSKNWSLTLMASGLFFFAIGRVVNNFVTGPLVDKHTAVKLFPFYQLPLTLGFFILAFNQAPWTPALVFLLFGLSVGSGGPIKSAIWAEIYGVAHLGAIKSMFATLMIFSTALSPALFGWVIDRNQDSELLLLCLVIASLISAVLASFALRMSPKH